MHVQTFKSVTVKKFEIKMWLSLKILRTQTCWKKQQHFSLQH